jgi:plastocyanin
MRLSLSLAILLAGFAGGAVTAQGPSQSITVQLSSFKFRPATLTLTHGRPYVIHFTNTSSGGHDFVAKDFFAAATIAPEDRSKVVKGGVSLGGGESTDIHLVPNTPGTYKSHCSHFMHSGFGMKGQVVVE